MIQHNARNLEVGEAEAKAFTHLVVFLFTWRWKCYSKKVLVLTGLMKGQKARRRKPDRWMDGILAPVCRGEEWRDEEEGKCTRAFKVSVRKEVKSMGNHSPRTLKMMMIK